MKRIFLLFLLFQATNSAAQTKHTFALSKADFLLDGRPFQIISGEMHPARIPREYWRQRIRMAKAMGCNTIAAYVFWNYHEARPGSWDFQSGNHDIAAFIRICQEEGLWVLIRPGPYVCAEWDFGGLPPWLLKIPDIKFRCMDNRYMSAVQTYIARLSTQIRPLLVTNGGPILMLQIENEYGSYGNDQAYLRTLQKYWLANRIAVPFYTADGAEPVMLAAGHIEGTAIGLDAGTSDRDFANARAREASVPAFSSETYPGWLTHWKENWARPDTNGLKRDINYLLSHHRSFSFYVIHGGTNFGFTAGANAAGPASFQPDITSYDYDAPIDEQGRATPKYHMLRKLIASYVSYPIPEIPEAIPVIRIPAIDMKPLTSIWQHLPAPIRSAQPVPMEYFDQNQGLALYRTRLNERQKGKLVISEPHDYALVFLDGKLIDSVYRDGGNWTVNLPAATSQAPVLDILVEGMGHINYGEYLIDRKGITDRVTLNGMTLMDWEIFPLSLDEAFIRNLKALPAEQHKGLFYQGEFNLGQTGDTYFDMSAYRKGLVFINGHNLGRFWDTGPQQRLYCPASWLKKGSNTLIVFDLLREHPARVSGFTTLSNP